MRAVISSYEQNRTGELRLNGGKLIPHGFGHFDRVYARAPKDSDHYGCARLRVATHPEAHVNALVLHALLGAGDILQINRRAVVLSNDQSVILLSRGELPLGLQQKAAMLSVDLPCAGITRAVLHRIGQIFDCDVPDCHRGRICFNPDRGLRAVHRNLTNSGQYAESLADLCIGVVVKLAFRYGVTDQRDVHDRLVVWVGLRECGRAGQIDRKLSRGAGDCSLNISCRRVQTF